MTRPPTLRGKEKSTQNQIVIEDFGSSQEVKIETAGVYQLDIFKRELKDGEKNRNLDLRVTLDGKTVTSQLKSIPFLVTRLKKGETTLGNP